MFEFFKNKKPEKKRFENLASDYILEESYYGVVFDGELTPNELGIPKIFVPDFQKLSVRSWQAYHESDIIFGLINRLAEWCIGTGISLSVEPLQAFLQDLGVKLTEEQLSKFSRRLEDLFHVTASNKRSTQEMRFDLNALSNGAFIDTMLTGDILSLYKYIGNRVCVQTLSGSKVINPTDQKEYEEAEARGNTISHGVERDENNRHVAFHVLSDSIKKLDDWEDYKTVRIEAYSKKTGLVLAKLCYANNNFRTDNVRGMPLISTIIEVAQQVTDYRKHTVEKADEISKSVYFATHNETSTGENPLEQDIVDVGSTLGVSVAQETRGYDNKALPASQAQKIAMSTGRKFINMPVGSMLETLESHGQLEFPDFYKTNFGAVCASVSTPPEVGAITFNSNYTASRMAVAFFKHIVNVRTNSFANQFLKPYIEMMLYVYPKLGIIDFDEVNLAKQNGWIAYASLVNCKWISNPLPKVDPLKEAITSRKLLGENSDHIPLSSFEQEARTNNLGDWNANVKKWSADFEIAKSLGIVAMQEPVAPVAEPVATPTPSKGK